MVFEFLMLCTLMSYVNCNCKPYEYSEYAIEKLKSQTMMNDDRVRVDTASLVKYLRSSVSKDYDNNGKY